MAGKSLGTLTLDLILKMGGFEQGMDKAARLTDTKMRQMQTRAIAVGTAIGNVLAVSITGAAKAIFNGVQAAADFADQLNDMNQRLGVSAEALSGWAYAAKQTGTDIDALGVGLKKLAKNMAEALDPKSNQAGLFEALGVSVKDAEGRLRDVEDVLPEIASKFKSLDNATQESALAMDLFGKSGTDLLEFMNQGADGLEALRARARDLGVELDGNTLKAADDFNDTLADIKTISEGLFAQLAAQLLPSLQRTAELFLEAAQEGTKAGISMADVGGAASSLVDWLGKANSVGAGTVEMLRNLISGSAQAVQGIGTLLFKDTSKGWQQIMAAKGKADAAYYYAFNDIPDFSTVQGTPKPVKFALLDEDPTGLFKRTAEEAKKAKKEADALAASLAKVYGGGDKKSKKSGKSEAEKEAERLAKAINQMADAQRDWETQLNGTGNQIADEYARKLSDITEKSEDFIRNGVPADKVKAFTEEMQRLALAIKDKDLLEFQQEFDDQTKEMIASVYGIADSTIRYDAAIRDLNKTLKSGVITQEEYADRAKALAAERDSAAIKMQSDAMFEIELLGKTREEQELLTAARYLGADASTEQGRAALAALKEMQDAQRVIGEQIGLMDDFRGSVQGLFSDIANGANAWDAVKDAFDNFADALFDFASKKVIENLFGQMGSSQTGSAGGWISTLLGLFTGGGSGGGPTTGPYAAGGWMPANSVAHVNEMGMEMATVRGRDYLLTGNSPVEITSANKVGAGGSMSVTQNFINPRMYDRSSDAQRQAEAARQLQRSTRFA